MKQDVEVRFTRRGQVIWQCRAEVMQLRPAEAAVDAEQIEPAVLMALKLHYTAKLDPVLRSPTDYNVEVVNRIVPDATIVSIQQTADGRYVELRVY